MARPSSQRARPLPARRGLGGCEAGRTPEGLAALEGLSALCAAHAIFFRLQFALRADMGRLGVEMQIHPTAQVESGAEIAEDAYIGPSCIVERGVVIGAGCRLVANVYVTGRATIGPRTVVHPFACLGGPPQSVAYKGEPTSLVIGADCTIRENVTMNRGTAGGGGETIVGDGGFFMAYSHVAHDCRIGREAIFANSATLAGHCVLGDNVILSGQVLVHQFTHIGSGAMISGGSRIRGDIIPFGLAAGEQARLVGVNVVGMRRRHYPVAAVQAVRSAFRMLFLAPGLMAERVAATDAALGHVDAVAEILAFLRAPRPRPLCQARGGASRDEALGEALVTAYPTRSDAPSATLADRDFKRILLIKLSAIGDVVHTIPLLHALRRRYPAARIDWLSKPTPAEFLRGLQGVDNIYVYGENKTEAPRYNWDGVAHWLGLIRDQSFLAMLATLRRAPL